MLFGAGFIMQYFVICAGFCHRAELHHRAGHGHRAGLRHCVGRPHRAGLHHCAVVLYQAGLHHRTGLRHRAGLVTESIMVTIVYTVIKFNKAFMVALVSMI